MPQTFAPDRCLAALISQGSQLITRGELYDPPIIFLTDDFDFAVTLRWSLAKRKVSPSTVTSEHVAVVAAVALIHRSR